MAPEATPYAAQDTQNVSDNVVNETAIMSAKTPLLPLYVPPGPPEYDNTKCSWLCCWEELK
jgi:hypothetical protein